MHREDRKNDVNQPNIAKKIYTFDLSFIKVKVCILSYDAIIIMCS